MNPRKIPLYRTHPHPADPFKPYTNEKLAELAASIADIGLLHPISVRKEADGTFTILAGKNRANACRMNDQKDIFAYVYDVDDDTAAMIITDSNLKNRDRLLPSERGFAYRMQLEALKRQGKRNDLLNTDEEPTSDLVGQKLKVSRDLVATHHKIGTQTVRRYLRLTYLIPELLEQVDVEKLSLYAGVDLSYLDAPSQHLVYTQLILGSPTPLDITKSARIKQLFKKHGTFTEDTLAPFRFQSRGTTEHITPLINRKMLKSLATDVPLPESDEELINQFIAFLREKYNARGSLEIKRETREAYY
ncbi:MAG: ParB/RepB/Spo0J family partition protein [Defluviitaleaceae bacterium]|nr:ParB/RepB/Spo0J family partition protein [Defluviitaleaceae bacterium]